MAINAGDHIRARTAAGTTVQLRAVGSPMRGRDFPVVWVCTEDEWNRSQATGVEPDSLPWPLDAVLEPLQV